MQVYLKLISTGSVFKIDFLEGIEPTVCNLKKCLAPHLGLTSVTGLLDFDLKILEHIKIKFHAHELGNIHAIPEKSESQPLELFVSFPEIQPARDRSMAPPKAPEIQWHYEARTQGRTSAWNAYEPMTLREDQLEKFLDQLLLKSEIRPEPPRYVTYHILQARFNGQILGQAVFPSNLFETYRAHPYQLSAGKHTGIDLKNIHWVPNHSLLEPSTHAQYFSYAQQCFDVFSQIMNAIFPALNLFRRTLLEQELYFFTAYLNSLKEKISPTRPPHRISTTSAPSPSTPLQMARDPSPLSSVALPPATSFFGKLGLLFRSESPRTGSPVSGSPTTQRTPETRAHTIGSTASTESGSSESSTSGPT